MTITHQDLILKVNNDKLVLWISDWLRINELIELGIIKSIYRGLGYNHTDYYYKVL